MRSSGVRVVGDECTALDGLDVLAQAKAGEVVYLDPPYWSLQSSQTPRPQYVHGYTAADHEALRDGLRVATVPWLLTCGYPDDSDLGETESPAASEKRRGNGRVKWHTDLIPKLYADRELFRIEVAHLPSYSAGHKNSKGPPKGEVGPRELMIFPVGSRETFERKRGARPSPTRRRIGPMLPHRRPVLPRAAPPGQQGWVGVCQGWAAVDVAAGVGPRTSSRSGTQALSSLSATATVLNRRTIEQEGVIVVDEWGWMRRAVDLAKNCQQEQRASPAPRVGVVAVLNGEVIGEAYRGQFNPGDHAEFCLIEKVMGGRSLAGATIFTTLEPCTKRNHPKVPCAKRLLDSGVTEVVIGLYDPNPVIYREGWRMLRDAGVRVTDFPADLRAEIRADNREFLDLFRLSTSQEGEASFDYTKHNGVFQVGSDGLAFETRWTGRGASGLWAYDDRHHVADARHAVTFEEVDDPGALDFSSRVVAHQLGRVVTFRKPYRGGWAFALVKLLEVREQPQTPHARISYQIRVPVGAGSSDESRQA
jgi:pyrimidine deaminase RibD-like protein